MVRVWRAAIAEDPRGVDHEHVRRGLRIVCPGDLLGLVAQIRNAAELVPLHARTHRLEGVARVALGVVGVDRQHTRAEGGVVARDRNDPLMPGERVGTVIAGEAHDRRRMPVECVRGPLRVRQRERGRALADRDHAKLFCGVLPNAACSASRTSAASGVGE